MAGGWGNVLHAEWTKLWTVRRWGITLAGAAVLAVLFSLLAAAGSRTDVNAHPNFVVGPNGEPVTDDLMFAHQSLTGDGTIVVKVVSQKDSHENARAGLLIKDGITSGSRYAAVYLTARHGVRFQADYGSEVSGSAATGTRWLKLIRSGSTVTGFESADGASWTEVGKVTATLPAAAEIGFFVSSPPEMVTSRQAGSTSVGARTTEGQAVFSDVTLNGAPGQWAGDPITGFVEDGYKNGEKVAPYGSLSEAGGSFTVEGAGDIGPNPPPDDVLQISLFGILPGLIALAAVAVLYITAEHKRGMIRTTFSLTPRRGQVLAAKGIVFGVTAFVIGLAAAVVAFLVAQPKLRANGFTAPGFPLLSLTDGAVIRTVLMTAAFVAAFCVFSLGLGALLRHSAAAIGGALGLLILPAIVGSAIPATAGKWLMLLTPAGGLATQRAKPPTDGLVEPWSMISSGAGLTVVCTYAVLTMVAAWLVQRRSDA